MPSTFICTGNLKEAGIRADLVVDEPKFFAQRFGDRDEGGEVGGAVLPVIRRCTDTHANSTSVKTQLLEAYADIILMAINRVIRVQGLNNRI